MCYGFEIMRNLPVMVKEKLRRKTIRALKLGGSETTQTIFWINSRDGLLKATGALGSSALMAVDLEADSMYHFTEKICLIQSACEKGCYIIDPLAIDDISPLGEIFADPRITKIFHGADYDVRSLYRDFSFTVNNLFDTQEACRFLGYSRTGLGSLVKRHFNIILDKKFQKKDWSVRPLADEMIKYAANDVLYLIPLYHILRKELIKKKRLSWAVEAGRDISKVRPDTAQNGQKPLFLRFKGAGRLDRLSLAVLENLLQFRMEAARKKNRPPFKIMGNKTLLDIALYKPKSLKQLEISCRLSPLQVRMYGESILACVSHALKTDPKDLPCYPKNRTRKISGPALERKKRLKLWRDETARKMEIEPCLILNKDAISALAVSNPKSIEQLNGMEGLKDWQKAVFGQKIIDILAG